MPSPENRVVIACAGSGKTTRLIDESLAAGSRRIAIVTYTNNNVREIRKRFAERNSGQPAHVDVMTWYTFLFRHCVRPYQRSKYRGKSVDAMQFVNRQSAARVPESNVSRYYFSRAGVIYSDKVSRFVFECQRQSSGAVGARLARIYTDVFVDEFQDLAGWDFEVIKLLLASGLRVTLVGDPRQHIYSTNPGMKNKQYLGIGVVKLVDEWRRQDLCTREDMNETHRCDNDICRFSNGLWPGMPEMTNAVSTPTGHNGVFLVPANRVHEYVREYRPAVLRHNKKANTFGYDALNFGQAKGLEFDRVLIVPTGPIKKYLQTGNLSEVEKARDKLHVAVTRARFSAAFVFDGESPIVNNRWVA